MESSKHIVVFSHGFGVRKDSRGLFSDIAAALPGVEPVMFDYNEIDDAKNTVTVRPLAQQSEMLRGVLREIKESAPNAVIDLICHSQGSIVASLAMPTGIRKTVFLAPPVNINSNRMLEAFRSRPGSEINMEGISKIARRDGSTTIVPSEFWAERKNLRPLELYGEFAHHTNLAIIKANQDEVLEEVSFQGLGSSVEVVSLSGDHNFTGNARGPLLEVIKKLLI